MSRIYELTCINCGQTFKAHAPTALRCDECKQERTRKQHKAYMARRRKSAELIFKKTLNEIMRDLKAYNSEHNTHLTYGQYVSKFEGRQPNGKHK